MSTDDRRLPILEFPGDAPGIIDPETFFEGSPRLPRACVLCFFKDVVDRRVAREGLERLATLPGEGPPTEVFGVGEGAERVALIFPGVGAPFASAVLEELIALGADHFVACGGAGTLDGRIPLGQVVIPTSALRQEGTSYHYQRDGRFSHPSERVVAVIEETCRAAGEPFTTGPTWTTDAPYRETREVIAARKAEGCLTVEMEASAFFAVARFRGVQFGQLLYAGDDVSGETWDHRGWTDIAERRTQLLDLAIAAARRFAS